MSINQKSVRVGELLVDAQIISSAEMTEAIQVSKRLGVPIGRVLMMSGSVRHDELAASLQIQPLVREGQIPYEAAISGLKRVHQLRMTMADALAQEDLRPDLVDNPEYLGELLLDSNLVAPEDMERAIQTSMASGIPLGSALVLQGLLSPALFPSLQRIQRQLVEGTLSREDGIKEVQDTFVHWLKAEESKDRPQAVPESGDAIVADPDEAPQAPPAENNGHNNHNRNAAPTAPTAPAVAAADAAVLPQPEPLKARDQVLAEVRLVDLLKSAGVFSQADVQRRYEAMLKDPVRSARFFLELGLLAEEDIKKAVRSHALMTKGSLTTAEAILALNSCRTGDLEKQLSETAPSNARVDRYMDKAQRNVMSKVLGGALFGALIAGLTFSNRGKK